MTESTPAETTIGRYLARRDVLPERVDIIVLMGSAVLESVEVAAQLHHATAARILISGGIGHSTHHLDTAVRRRGLTVAVGRPESHVFRDVLTTQFDVPAAALQVEDQSTNCGDNAAFTRRLIDEPAALVLIQDPTMQRRTHASFARSFADLPGTQLISHAPVLPWIGPEFVSAGPDHPEIWGLPRFRSLVLGEIRRLHDDEHGYGPRGRNFIDHVDIPALVLAAYAELATAHPHLIRPAGA
ncbi:YdcF family protein [Kribbella antibiotica]|uniref:YdcF family protein n=1 Tax=Kribbella antibiotica TaxID=190195 RepID=A0A4R4ZQD5_9ACTN|nr:YdcF family protein [Kribbella antibiotica]TDD60935.1 YdcF family protein [Kribbella antibiotica]